MTSRTAEASEAFDLEFNGPLSDFVATVWLDVVVFWVGWMCFVFWKKVVVFEFSFFFWGGLGL